MYICLLEFLRGLGLYTGVKMKMYELILLEKKKNYQPQHDQFSKYINCSVGIYRKYKLFSEGLGFLYNKEN